jgi:hypothetical protein
LQDLDPDLVGQRRACPRVFIGGSALKARAPQALIGAVQTRQF